MSAARAFATNVIVFKNIHYSQFRNRAFATNAFMFIYYLPFHNRILLKINFARKQ